MHIFQTSRPRDHVPWGASKEAATFVSVHYAFFNSAILREVRA